MAEDPQPAKAKAKREQKNPVYTVVQPEGKNLKVVEPKVSAKNQDDAMEQVAESIRKARNAPSEVPPLGAFLANSYREKEFEAEVTTKWKGKSRPPSFLEPKAIDNP